MRHRVSVRKLGRTTSHRLALLRNLLAALFVHERITTTLAKAKEARTYAERMITLGKRGDLAARRRAAQFLQDKDIVKKVFGVLAARYKDRRGGYTRIMKYGRREGDGASVALMELVDRAVPKKTAEGKKTGDGKKKKEEAPPSGERA